VGDNRTLIEGFWFLPTVPPRTPANGSMILCLRISSRRRHTGRCRRVRYNAPAPVVAWPASV